MTANYDIAPSFWRVYQTQQSFVGSLSNRNRIASNVRCSISQILRKSEKNERFASSSSPFGHRWIWGEQPFSLGSPPALNKTCGNSNWVLPYETCAKNQKRAENKKIHLLSQTDLLLYSLIFFYLYGSNHWSSSDFIILCRLNFEFQAVPLDKLHQI